MEPQSDWTDGYSWTARLMNLHKAARYDKNEAEESYKGDTSNQDRKEIFQRLDGIEEGLRRSLEYVRSSIPKEYIEVD